MINKKHIILFIFLLHLITPQLFSNNKNLLLSKTFDELLIELDSAVNFRKNFVQQHENKIIQTKEQETTTDSALLVKYEKLIGLYYFYQSDSCIHYINRAINLLESANQSLHSKTAKQKYTFYYVKKQQFMECRAYLIKHVSYWIAFANKRRMQKYYVRFIVLISTFLISFMDTACRPT